ncbi:MAG TPA: hypothetical protein VN329_09580 [Roseomonas sp.]|nr:hypothetical protein [Roseomonas sp.]
MATACLIAAALLGGCRDSASTPEATRPGGLTVSVGGSVGTAGAVVSQPRTDAARPR